MAKRIKLQDRTGVQLLPLTRSELVQVSEITGLNLLNNKVWTAATVQDVLAALNKKADDISAAEGTNLTAINILKDKLESFAAERDSVKTYVDTELANKVDKVEGSSLMTEAEHTKLGGIETGAQVNVIEGIKLGANTIAPDANKVVDLGNIATTAAMTSAIEALDADVTSTDGTNVQVQVAETDGKITAVSIATDNTINATDLSDAIAGLDSSVEATAADGNQYSVLTGVTETDGKLTAKTEVKLAAVAKTGAAADVTIADASNKITATNVEGALTELATSIETANTNNAVTMSEAAGSGDVLKVYTISQGGTSIGTINIPKDLVAVSGEIVYKDGENNDGTFIKLTIQNGNPFYIDVASLIEYNSVDSTAEVTLSQDANHKITATIGKIAASKIVYREADTANNITEETVAQAISRIDTALGAGGSVASQIQTEIEKLDSSVTATGTPAKSGVMVLTKVDEVDGKLNQAGSVSVEVEAAGAAAAAKATIDDYTVNGKKISTSPTLYAGDIAISSSDANTVAARLTSLETADNASVKSVNTKTPSNGAVTINGSDIKLDGYSTGTYSAIAATDTVNQAIAKLEGGYITYEASEGTYDDTTI